MSVHVEWMDAAHTHTEVLQPGAEVADDTVDVDKYAIVISADQVLAIEGTPQQLRDLATGLLWQVGAADARYAKLDYPQTPPGWRPDPTTLRWAAGQVRAAAPSTPDTAELHCADRFNWTAARRLYDHAQHLDDTHPQED